MSWSRFWRVSAIAHLSVLVLRFSYVWLDDLVRQSSGTFPTRFIEEVTGALGFFLLSGVAFREWLRAPLRGAAFWERLPAYLLLGLAISAANTSFMWASRTAVFPHVGLGAYDYGRMPLRYLMEAPSALVGFAMILGALWRAEEIVEQRQQAIAHVSLQRALAESQLRSLRLQLQPHFLFNALNTIAAQLHEDPRGADRLIGRLSELLRVSLRATDVMLVPLRDELALLSAYADLMRARFGARLDLQVDVEGTSGDEMLPPLLLQPLVENAVRHGGLERNGQARIAVTARHGDGRLVLRVHDDGPGVDDDRDLLTAGSGLSTTARRVELLFGAGATLLAHNADGGGFEVVITLPVRTR
ncbi:MAG: histidine kinase [Gemmatimonadaceae bacterium]|nr:histidine kinase [Gemmatimonadaceae bacterium]